MQYLKVSEIAKSWGVSPRRVRILCSEGKIPGVIRKGKLYLVPKNAVKPADGRLSGSATLSNQNMKNKHQSNFRSLVEEGLVCRKEDIKTESCYNSNEKIISAGVVYFYLCGISEDDSVILNVVDSYRCLPEKFYNKVFSIIADSEDLEECVHLFGVIGIPNKIERISSITELGIKENCNRIISGNNIIKEDDGLDYPGNLYFRMIQEFFLEEPDHFPYKLTKDNDDWKLNCLWCGKTNDETLHALADGTIEIWLENEAPEMLGKQLMLRSFFTRDFVNRKLVACFPKKQNKEWQLLFEGGHSITLGTEKFYKGTASSNDVGFFFCFGNKRHSNESYIFTWDIFISR